SVELTFSDFAIRVLDDSQYRGGGVKPLHGVIAVEEKSGEMAAIGVTQAAGSVVIFGEEERGERAVRRVIAEKLVHRAEEALRLLQSKGALAATICLQMGHQ